MKLEKLIALHKEYQRLTNLADSIRKCLPNNHKDYTFCPQFHYTTPKVSIWRTGRMSDLAAFIEVTSEGYKVISYGEYRPEEVDLMLIELTQQLIEDNDE